MCVQVVVAGLAGIAKGPRSATPSLDEVLCVTLLYLHPSRLLSVLRRLRLDFSVLVTHILPHRCEMDRSCRTLINRFSSLVAVRFHPNSLRKGYWHEQERGGQDEGHAFRIPSHCSERHNRNEVILRKSVSVERTKIIQERYYTVLTPHHYVA